MGKSKSKQSNNSESQQTSNSYNQSYGTLNSALSPELGRVGQSNNAIRDLLGLNGGVAQTQGFDNFRNSSSYNFLQNEGLRGVTANNAFKGLLGSGAALRGAVEHNTNLASQFLDKYLANLSGLSSSGLQAGQLLTSAGNVSNSQGTSKSTGKGSSSSFQLG